MGQRDKKTKQGLIRKGEGEKEGIFYYRQETYLLREIRRTLPQSKETLATG